MGLVRSIASVPVAATTADALTERAFAAGPVALRPDWLRRTWSEGAFGAERLRAVDARATTIKLEIGERALRGNARVEGNIHAGDTKVGNLKHAVELHPDGRLTVKHVEIQLDPDRQRKGFATGYYDHAISRYRDAGVDAITLDADLTVGGYAWARSGYEIAASGATEGERAVQRAVQLRAIVEGARHKLTADQLAQLTPRLIGDDLVVRPQTLTSVQDLAAIEYIGERVLLGSKWEGIRTLDRTQAWWGATGAQASQPAPMADVARGISELMPPPFDLARSLDTLERHAAVPVRDGLALIARRNDSVLELNRTWSVSSAAARLRFDVLGDAGAPVDNLEVVIRGGPDGATAQLLQGRQPIPAEIRERLTEGLRELGVQ